MRNVKNSEPIRALRYAVRLDHRLERLQSPHALQPVSLHAYMFKKKYFNIFFCE